MIFSRNPFRKSGSIHLTKEERDQVRATLISYMQEHPLPERTVKALLASVLRPATVGAAVALITLSAGASYAAERALPGDFLYPVKIGVNERMRAVAASLDGNEGRWGVRRIERRLEEAEQLITLGALTRETSTQLAETIITEAQTVRTRIAHDRDDRVIENAALEADLNAIFGAHTHLLNRLSLDDAAVERHKPLVVAVAPESIIVLTGENGDVGGKIIRAIANDATFRKKQIAEAKLNEANKEIERSGRTMDQGTSARVAELIAEAGKARALAEVTLESGMNAEAFELYQQTHQLAQEAKLLMKARGKLGRTPLNEQLRPNSPVQFEIIGTSVTDTERTEKSSTKKQKMRDGKTPPKDALPAAVSL